MRSRIILAILMVIFACSLASAYPDKRAEQLYNRGIKCFNQRKYQKASQYFSKIVKFREGCDRYPYALYYLARSYSYMKSPMAAIETYGKLYRDFRQHTLADDALFEMGLLYKKLGLPDLSSQAFWSLAYYYPNSELYHSALWNAGTQYYKSGNYSAAYSVLLRSTGEASDRTLYWTAKAAEKYGATPEAIAFYQKTISLFDHSYYGYRAREELRQPVSRTDWSYAYPRGYQPLVEKYSAQYGLDPLLTYAVILQESRFRPRARSRSNARGLMQIIPPTGRKLSRDLGLRYTRQKLYNPRVNVQMGTYFLSELIKNYNGNVHLALAAYNGGPGRVSRWLQNHNGSFDLDVFVEDIPIRETREYVKKVMKHYYGYKRTYS